MTPSQRAAALRLADELQRFDGLPRESLNDEAAALLREIASDSMHGMSPMNRTIAYSAAAKLRELGYVWDDKAWVLSWLASEPAIVTSDHPDSHQPQAEPVAWRSKTRINNEFDSGWHLTSTEPPQTPRTVAIEPLYAHPQQQHRPLSVDEFIRPLINDTNEVFNADGPETPQVVRDVIEYMQSWIEVYFDKRAHGIGGGDD